jgi:hypothetical protein
MCQFFLNYTNPSQPCRGPPLFPPRRRVQRQRSEHSTSQFAKASRPAQPRCNREQPLLRPWPHSPLPGSDIAAVNDALGQLDPALRTGNPTVKNGELRCRPVGVIAAKLRTDQFIVETARRALGKIEGGKGAPTAGDLDPGPAQLRSIGSATTVG